MALATYRNWLVSADRSRLVAVAEQGFASVMSLSASVLVGRYCGISDLGTYSLLWSVIVFAISTETAMVGMPYTVRVQQMRGPQLPWYRAASLANLFAVAASCSIIVLVAATLAKLLSQSDLSLGLVIVAMIVPAITCRDLLRRWFFAEFRMHTALAMTLLAALTQIGVLLIGIATNRMSVAWALLSLGLGAAAACGWAAFQSGIVLKLRPRQVGTHLFADWQLGKWIFAYQAAALLHSHCIFWICQYCLPAETGVLAAFVTLSSLVNPILLGLINAGTPQFARAQGNPTEIARLYMITTALLGSIAAVAWLLFLLVGESVAVNLYGRPELSGSTMLIAILGLRIVISSIGMTPNLMLVASGQPIKSFLCVTVGLFATCLTAIPLANRFHLIGLAVAWTIGMACETLAFSLTLPRLLNSPGKETR